jgi:hypothetical protein
LDKPFSAGERPASGGVSAGGLIYAFHDTANSNRQNFFGSFFQKKNSSLRLLNPPISRGKRPAAAEFFEGAFGLRQSVCYRP